MGQKVDPKSFRLGIIKSWSSNWFAEKNYADLLHRDLTLRRAIRERLPNSGIGEIEIESQADQVKVKVFTSKPGLVIGRQGIALEELRQDLSHQFDEKIEISVLEVRKPELCAQFIAETVAEQITRRFPFRRAAKQAIKRARDLGIKGIKLRIAGRLNGADIARKESFKEGNIPLHTLRSNIDLGKAVARTTYGAIGVKAWTYKGEIFQQDEKAKKITEDRNWLAESRKKTDTSPRAREMGRLETELTKNPR